MPLTQAQIDETKKQIALMRDPNNKLYNPEQAKSYEQNLGNYGQMEQGILQSRMNNPQDVLYKGNVQTNASSQTPGFDADAYYNNGAARLTETAKRQEEFNLTKWRQAREKSASEIGTLKNDANVAFQQNRDQTDFQSKVAAQRLREMMAAQGLGNSGENVTGQVGINTANQNAMNALNLQERRTIDDYDKELRDLYDPSKEYNITEQSSIDLLNRLYDLQTRADDRKYDNDWRTADFNRQGQWHDDETDFRDKSFAADQQWRNVDNGWKAREWNRQGEQDKYAQSKDARDFAEQQRQFNLQYALSRAKSASSGGGRRGGSGSKSSVSDPRAAAMDEILGNVELFRSPADAEAEYFRNEADIVKRVGREGFNYAINYIRSLPKNFSGGQYRLGHSK